MELAGRVLGGRYRIVRRIGAGGMGGVYEAIQQDLGRRVAIKVISEQLVGEPIYLERFRREALASAQLGHPNIVAVSDFEQPAGEAPFLVMEMLDGEPLNQRLGRGAFTPALAIDVTLQILAGVGAAHARGIVHRDLKPGNVFLVPLPGDQVLAKVLDFGIAKLMDSATYGRLTQTGVLVGTPRYAAPEQLRDSKSVDARADVYAVGALLYCMLTGRPPYASHGAQLLVDIAEREPNDPRETVPDLDPGLVAVVRRAMAKRPEHRFGSAGDFAAALAPFAARSVRAAAPSPDASAPRIDPTERSASPSPSFPSPPTSTPATVAARTWQPAPAEHPPHAAQLAAPTYRAPAPPRPKPTLLFVGVGAGVLLGLLTVLGIVVGVWLGARRSEAEARRAAPTDAPTIVGPMGPPSDVTVPEVCLAWQEMACGCPNGDVAQQTCHLARGRIDRIRLGIAPAHDCASLLAAAEDGCWSALPGPGSPQPRSEMGVPVCDAYVRFACACGAADAARDLRCTTANATATAIVTEPGTFESRNEACRAQRVEAERACRAAR